MRFAEIANPEDQLALWRLVSDKMWAAFGQQAYQQPNPVSNPLLATPPYKKMAKPISNRPAKPQSNRKATQVKVHKPKKAPMAPAPKPLPKPQPQQLTPTQAAKQQTQQNQLLAHHIQQVLSKRPATKTNFQSIQPKAPEITSEVPMNSSYSERDKDDHVMHSRNNPFKPLDIK